MPQPRGGGRRGANRGSNRGKHWGPCGLSVCSHMTQWGKPGFTAATGRRGGGCGKRRLYFPQEPSRRRRERGCTADTRRGGACGAVRGPDRPRCWPGRPVRHCPIEFGARRLSLENCCRFACCTEAWRCRRRKVPQKQRFDVRAWSPETRGLPQWFPKSVGTGSHWRLKADKRGAAVAAATPAGKLPWALTARRQLRSEDPGSEPRG